jgi:hypothetical protein
MWTYERIEKMVKDQDSEGLYFEYKGANALGKQNDKKTAITKVISSFANAAGGTVIYGIATYNDGEREHLPEKIDPIRASEYSKEWLQQAINQTQPRPDVEIFAVPVPGTPELVLYVVEIPQSVTVHQALDKKYYKRLNATTIAMEHYEILDVLGRSKHPKFEVDVSIRKYKTKPNWRYNTSHHSSEVRHRVRYRYELVLKATNTGSVFANHIVLKVHVPARVLHRNELNERNSGNPMRDERIPYTFSLSSNGQSIPVLPGLDCEWTVRLRKNCRYMNTKDWQIKWYLYADNAPTQTGSCNGSDMPIILKKGEYDDELGLDMLIHTDDIDPTEDDY